MALSNYDPAKVVMTFKGSLMVGYVDGTFISAERDADAFTADVGSQGDVVRVKSNNRMGEVTLTLQQSSPSNDILSAHAVTDELTGLNTGALLIKDLQGTTLLTAEAAWVKKQPVSEFGNELSDREWVFTCAELLIVTGGASV